MGPVTRVWLVRHGAVAAEGLCYGRMDVELSEEGRRQMRAVAARLAGEAIECVYTSPLRRARASAELLGRGATVVEGLREMDFGAFEGRRYEEIEAEWPALYQKWMREPARVRFPEGESFGMLRKRVLAAMAEIRRRHAGGTVAVVAHGGVVRCVLGEVLGMRGRDVMRIGQRYGGVSLVEFYGEVGVVERMNEGE